MIMKSMLRYFELTSDLKMNFSIIKIGRIGVQVNKLQRLATILHCGIMDLPFRYLGIKLGRNHKRVSF